MSQCLGFPLLSLPNFADWIGFGHGFAADLAAFSQPYINGVRLIMHWYRNIFSHVPSTKVREITAMLRAIPASEDIVAAWEKAVRVIEKLRALRLIKAAEFVEKVVEKTPIYYAFPEEHWRRIRTHNPLERTLREIRPAYPCRRFPDGTSARQSRLGRRFLTAICIAQRIVY